MKLYWAPRPQPRALLLLLGSLLLIGAIIGVLHLCGVRVCPLKRYTGIPCFTCGSTRALFELFQGEFKRAFLLQPLVISALLLSIPPTVISLYTGLVQNRLPKLLLTKAETIIVFLATLSLALLNWAYLIWSTR